MHEDIKRRDLPRAAPLALLLRKFATFSMSLLIPRTSTNLALIDSASGISGSMLRYVLKVKILIQ